MTMYPFWYPRPDYYWNPFWDCNLEKCKKCKYRKKCGHRKVLRKQEEEKVTFDKVVIE